MASFFFLFVIILVTFLDHSSAHSYTATSTPVLHFLRRPLCHKKVFHPSILHPRFSSCLLYQQTTAEFAEALKLMGITGLSDTAVENVMHFSDPKADGSVCVRIYGLTRIIKSCIYTSLEFIYG